MTFTMFRVFTLKGYNKATYKRKRVTLKSTDSPSVVVNANIIFSTAHKMHKELLLKDAKYGSTHTNRETAGSLHTCQSQAATETSKKEPK